MKQDLSGIVEEYGLKFGKLREDIPLFGSPERTEYRVAFDDAEGKPYIFEEVAESRLEKKRAIARTLSALSAADPLLPIAPYVRSATGGHLLETDGRYVQVLPYIEGVSLDRERYLDDSWRGEALARFLLRMRAASARAGLDRNTELKPFSLREYVCEVAAKMGRYDSETLSDVRPVLDHLESGYFLREGSLPISFCHGDYHPMNVVWGEGRMNAVIDWEFCGPKPELYDAANMVGCLGMEDPAAFIKPIVTDFLAVLREEGDFAEESWRSFPDLVLSLRFAWLSEWLRFKERGLIALEAEYMNLILENRDFLSRVWNIA